MIGKSAYKTKAFENFELLGKVVKFKTKFYRDNWANYEETLNHKFKLVPPEYRLSELEKDYKQTQEMLYGEIPTFV